MAKNPIHESVYYNRLDKLALWPIVGYLALVFIVGVSLFFVFHMYYMPSVFMSLSNVVSGDVLEFVDSRMSKVANTLFFWAGMLTVLNSYLVYIVWNSKKLLAVLSQNVDGDAVE